MEVLVVIVFLISGLAFALGRGRTNRRDAPPRQTMPSGSTEDTVLPFGSTSSKIDANCAETQTVKIVLQGSAYVVDGDTLVIQKTQIRLFGVDAPELNHPYGKQAKWALFSFCKGQKVRAEVTAIDAHGRTVARCYLQDGGDLSAEMVKVGLAIDWPKFSGGRYRSMETPDARKRLWLADARQKGRMHVWEQFEAKQKANLIDK